MPRADTEKSIEKLYNVDFLEGQGTQGTQRLPPPQLLGYLEKSED